MKPLNLDNRPCSPISSNCVIWQGPDIPCIKLCTGDTISDVVFKLATELCTIMDQLKVSNYDLTCLNLNACPPDDFQALIQLLIDKVCELNGIPTTPEKSSGCPDCVVSVAPCFVQGTTTTMQLVDYVQMIANKICSILSDITEIKDDISTINTTLIDIQTQIDNLPTYTLPKFPVNCILPSGDQSLDVIVEALMNNPTVGYCRLLNATGTPADINTSVLSQCIADIDQPLAALALDPPVVSTFSAYYSGSWVSNGVLTTNPTIANAIKNIWVAICDVRNYVSNIPTTVVEAGTGITVTSATVGNVTTYTVSTNEGAGLTVEEPCQCDQGLASNADVYVYIDISSGPYAPTCANYFANKLSLCEAVNDWYINYQISNPTYTGSLYVFEINQPETYLGFPRMIKNGSLTGVPYASGFNWLDVDTATPGGAPLNWNTPSWVAPTAILFISFVNEATAGSIPSINYHGVASPPSLTVGSLQPTSAYITDHTNFVSDYNSHWDFFKGVIYPANIFNNDSRNFLLHAYAATTNISNISSTDLSTALGTNYDIVFGSITYPISNVYVTANKGLWDYGWYSILDKSTTGGGCTLEFTAEEFATDLDNILGTGGGGSECGCASIVDSWNPGSQTLALRKLTSCTLDISVSESGCINIENQATPTEIAVTDTNTVNLTYNSGTLTAAVQDTGWVKLEGFNYMSGNAGKPECRRIGNELHFRGVIQIPMGDSLDGAGGNIKNVTNPDGYKDDDNAWVYDAGQTTLANDPNQNACVIYSAGPTSPGIASTSAAYNKHEGTIIRFRRGQSVIPTSVLPSASTYLDGTYSLGRSVVARSIQIGNVPGSVTGFTITLAGSGYSTGLYTVYGGSGTGFIVKITSVDFAGGITSAIVGDGGASYTVGDVLYVYDGNTPLARLTVTSIGTVIKDLYLQTFVSVFIDSAGTLNISAPNSIENFNGEGLKYGGILRNVVHNTIKGDYIPSFAHEPFSVNNADGEIPSDRLYGPELKASKAVWPFSVNCNNAAELGGFSIRLDGLRSFIKPCAIPPNVLPDLPTPTPVCS